MPMQIEHQKEKISQNTILGLALDLPILFFSQEVFFIFSNTKSGILLIESSFFYFVLCYFSKCGALNELLFFLKPYFSNKLLNKMTALGMPKGEWITWYKINMT